mgnify:CR=1 FL=1
MVKKEEIHVTNTYSGSDWDYEKTTKYIFLLGDYKVEAGYFEHYRKDVLVKNVIELPQSYGCPSKCKFCASSAITEFKLITSDELWELFEYIYHLNGLEKNSYVLLTMTGMGDLYFNFENVMKFLEKTRKYSNLYITLSSCLWNALMLKQMEERMERLKVRNIQITYVSHQQDILQAVIPIYNRMEYDFDAILRYIQQSKYDCYRINYIMIQDVNDDMQSFEMLRDMVEPIKDKVVIRISKLNETMASRRNGLCPTGVDVLEKFHQLLEYSGIRSYVFYADVNDNMNCGQLITENGEQ